MSALGFETPGGGGGDVAPLWPARTAVPDLWREECDSKRVLVEVKPSVPGFDDRFDWVPIPTSDVQHGLNRPKHNAIKQVAKVEFPIEWGDDPEDVVATNNVLNLLKLGGPLQAKLFLKCRIAWKNDDGTYVYPFLGYVSNVTGSTGNPLTGEFYVYDFLTMLDGIALTDSLDEDVTLREYVRRFGDYIVDSPVPMNGMEIAQATKEEGGIVLPNGKLRESVSEFTNTEFFGSGVRIEPGNGYAEPTQDGGDVLNRVIVTKDSSPPDQLPDSISNKVKNNSYTFTENKDTIIDAFEKIVEVTDGRYWFQPGPSPVNPDATDPPESVRMMFDIRRKSRFFYQRSIPNGQRRDDKTSFEDVTVIENNALADINPITTVTVLGKTKRNEDTGVVEYPRATVHAKPLLKAAGGAEVAVTKTADEVDVSSLDGAKRVAKKTLKQRIKQEGEGEIRLEAEPHVYPGDTIVAYETCGDLFIGQDESGQPFEPTEYEVHTVEHRQTEGGTYETVCTTSIHLEDKRTNADENDDEDDFIFDKETGMEKVRQTGDVSTGTPADSATPDE